MGQGHGKVFDLATADASAALAVSAAGQQAVQTAKGLLQKNKVHPLVERLAAGMFVFSQSFWEDFWLVLKNKHILVSVFLVHSEHYFTGGERFSVLLVSLCFAFSLSTIFAYWAKEIECRANHSGDKDCLKNAEISASTTFTIIFSIISSLLQMCYDQSAAALVTCEGVQTCPVCIKFCIETLSKLVFWVQGAFGVLLLVVSATMLVTVGWNLVTPLLMFVVTKMSNFALFTTLALLLTYSAGRRGQIKPPADSLKTARGSKRWNEPRPAQMPCFTDKGPRCELWNKYIGADKTFQDLPLHPHDYDIIVRVSCCCSDVGCDDCDRVVYHAKAKDPWPDVETPSHLPPSGRCSL